jgi:hypothetical protein
MSHVPTLTPEQGWQKTVEPSSCISLMLMNKITDMSLLFFDT